MLHFIPTQRPATGHTIPRKYEVARPETVQTDADADAFIAGLLAGREDAELVNAPVMGRDRLLRPVVVVTVVPRGCKPMPGTFVPTFTLQ